MVLGPIITDSINTNWMVAIFDFPNTNPSSDDFSAASFPVEIYGSSTQNTKKAINEIEKSLKSKSAFSGPKLQLKTPTEGVGITSVSFSRSKASPAGTCQIQCVGKLSKAMVAGNWVSVFSYGFDNQVHLTRFCGQIQSISTNFSVDGSGNFLTRSVIVVREWSHCLTANLNFDLTASITDASNDFGKFSLVAGAADIVNNAVNSGTGGGKKYIDAIQEAFDPLSLAQFILRVYGSLNETDTLNTKSLNNTKNIQDLQPLAITAPYIPKAVMQFLNVTSGLKVDDNSLVAAKPYSSGFVKVVSGHMSAPTTAHFKSNYFIKDGINSLTDDMKLGYENNQFVGLSNGMGALASLNMSPWAMITRHCDPEIYEFFTDIWYEVIDGQVKSQPVIVMRDRPFFTNNLLTDTKVLDYIKKDPFGVPGVSQFSKYEYVPTINLDSKYITELQLENTILDSVNFIGVKFANIPLERGIAEAKSGQVGRVRLVDEMKRHGGNEYYMNVNFVKSKDNNLGILNTDAIYHVYKCLALGWYGFDFKFYRAGITIKDPGLPLCIGMNLQFSVGEMIYVGHIDSFSTQFTIGPTGQQSTSTRINLSRVMMSSAMLSKLKGLPSFPFGPPHQFIDREQVFLGR